MRPPRQAPSPLRKRSPQGSTGLRCSPRVGHPGQRARPCASGTRGSAGCTPPEMSALPEAARAVCEAWLGEMDRTAPGLVTGLHVRGGIGFGEFVPGRSDVDFVAVLSRRPSMDDEELIEAAHVATSAGHPDVPFDGMHLLAADL